MRPTRLLLYVEAIKLAPESVDAHLNLANAYLLAGTPPRQSNSASKLSISIAIAEPAYYLMVSGICTWIRQSSGPGFSAVSENRIPHQRVELPTRLAQERLGPG